MSATSGKTRPKSAVYRVTGLPNLSSEDEVASFLRYAIENELVEVEGLDEEALASTMKRLGKINIVLLHNDSIDNSHALMEWKPGGFPEFLSALNEDPSSNWGIEFGGYEIYFDRNFLGFTQLFSTKADKPITADIIALTGLDGHAYGSFRGKGNLGKMWLRDFLSIDLPTCRTLIYGYDSKLSSHGIDTIMDYGRGFLEEVKKVRKTKEELRRPLFFIAHSFGGIIVAHSICKASMINDSEDPAIASLYKATYGILFFGTPHKGLAVENIRKMLLGNTQHPRQDLLDTIDEKSYTLISQLSDFKNVLRGRKVVSFFEQAQTRSLAADESTKSGFSRTGEYATMVKTDSALLQLPDAMEVKIPLQLDHSQLVKYDNNKSIGYTSALHYLAEFERDAPAIVRARFLQKSIAFVPSSNVPYPQDSKFVGRRDILEKLEARLISSGSHSRIALVGLGGMGKSQISIEFSYILRQKSEETWVFWVYARTVARFEQSYREIADKLELDGRHDPTVDILQLVSRWLSDERHGRWLLIIDNADDAGMFSTPTAEDQALIAILNDSSKAGTNQSLLAYIPMTATGTVLVTSRSKDLAHRIVGNHANDLIDVQAMTENEALDLLKAKLPDKQPLTGSKELLEELHNIPLAIAQAAAYITRGSPRMTISKYLNLFRESDSNRDSLLNQDAGDLRRDPEVANAAVTTWQISFDQVRQDCPFAAELLSLMSVLNRQGIPEFLIPIPFPSTSRLDVEAAIALLLGYSLITAHLGEESFDMHQLVHLATRKWLTVHHVIGLWNQRALQLISQEFPLGEFEDWKECEALLPHVETVLSYSFETKENLLRRASVLHKLSRYLYQRGKFSLSKEKIVQALEIRKRYLEEGNDNLLMTMEAYGSVLIANGEFDEALPIDQQVLASREKTLGKEHPNTLMDMSSLAELLRQQGKYCEAQHLLRQVVDLAEKVMGKEHRSTLIYMNNLGLVFQLTGKYEEAESMFRQALASGEKILGKEHPTTLIWMNNLADLLKARGNYDEAEPILRRTHLLRVNILGEEHPNTLRTLTKLGELFRKQEKYEKAEATLRQSLELWEKGVGLNHPSTLSTMNGLALVLLDLQKPKDAEAIFRQMTVLSQKLYGLKHPTTQTGMSNMATALEWQEKYKDAEIIHRQILKLKGEALGAKHPDTLQSMDSLASVLSHQGKHEDAVMLSIQTLALKTRTFGKTHPGTISTRDSLAFNASKLSITSIQIEVEEKGGEISFNVKMMKEDGRNGVLIEIREKQGVGGHDISKDIGTKEDDNTPNNVRANKEEDRPC